MKSYVIFTLELLPRVAPFLSISYSFVKNIVKQDIIPGVVYTPWPWPWPPPPDTLPLDTLLPGKEPGTLQPPPQQNDTRLSLVSELTPPSEKSWIRI